MNLKRIAAAILAAALIVMTGAMTASADSIFDSAKSIDSGKKVSKTLDTGKSMSYKIAPTEKGTASVKVTAKTFMFYFYVYDQDGNDIAYEYDATMGKKDPSSGNGFWWDSSAETFKGTFTWDVKANKTYYVQIKRYAYSTQGSGKFEVSFKYPAGESKSSDIPLMTLSIKKGDTIRLGSTASDAVWTSSQKSVATVSDSGLVTAVKKGKSVITLKSGSQTQKIQIIVE